MKTISIALLTLLSITCTISLAQDSAPNPNRAKSKFVLASGEKALAIIAALDSAGVQEIESKHDGLLNINLGVFHHDVHALSCGGRPAIDNCNVSKTKEQARAIAKALRSAGIKSTDEGDGDWAIIVDISCTQAVTYEIRYADKKNATREIVSTEARCLLYPMPNQ